MRVEPTVFANDGGPMLVMDAETAVGWIGSGGGSGGSGKYE
jgi:hypothetical protein